MKIQYIILLFLFVGCGAVSAQTTRAPTNSLDKFWPVSVAFKNYDTAFRDSIVHRWKALLDGNKSDQQRIGKVVLQFHLNYDGSVTDMKVIEDSVGKGQAPICQQAVLSSAPFPSWPARMRELIGANYRAITFTFNYSDDHDA